MGDNEQDGTRSRTDKEQDGRRMGYVSNREEDEATAEVAPRLEYPKPSGLADETSNKYNYQKRARELRQQKQYILIRLRAYVHPKLSHYPEANVWEDWDGGSYETTSNLGQGISSAELPGAGGQRAPAGDRQGAVGQPGVLVVGQELPGAGYGQRTPAAGHIHGPRLLLVDSALLLLWFHKDRDSPIIKALPFCSPE
ncbi:hypothetical protein BDP27DRAFT_1361763 [Rhodocollybia butyracea]|uniref:Uncharacterized protein n=1 Tax=Rhodocollybia butyracea TaxID=206335 RepID=A0A9P5U931_9AGAR|nr:hypothetical protein BDP27DRAFT_1361763 [Rhodocollybia butyracea]